MGCAQARIARIDIWALLGLDLMVTLGLITIRSSPASSRAADPAHLSLAAGLGSGQGRAGPDRQKHAMSGGRGIS